MAQREIQQYTDKQLNREIERTGTQEWLANLAGLDREDRAAALEYRRDLFQERIRRRPRRERDRVNAIYAALQTA